MKLNIEVLENRDCPSTVWNLSEPGDYFVRQTPTEVIVSKDNIDILSSNDKDIKIINENFLNKLSISGTVFDDFVKMGGNLVNFDTPSINRHIEFINFNNVLVDAIKDESYDTLEIKDSLLSDHMVFKPNEGILERGDGIVHEFKNFDKNTYTANSGKAADADLTELFDTEKAETFQSGKYWAVYRDASNDFDLYLKNPEKVILNGDKGNLNHITGTPTGFTLTQTGFYPVKHFSSYLDRATALFNIKKRVLLMDPSIGSITDKTELAIKLREFVFSHIRLGKNMAEWQSQDAFERFLDAIVSREKLVHCQGKSWLYIDCLNAFGISAREVGLVSSNIAPVYNTYYTHSSVEVYLNSRWVVMDPTWNMSIKDSTGRLISFKEMRMMPWEFCFDSPITTRYLIMDGCETDYSGYLNSITYRPLWV